MKNDSAMTLLKVGKKPEKIKLKVIDGIVYIPAGRYYVVPPIETITVEDYDKGSNAKI